MLRAARGSPWAKPADHTSPTPRGTDLDIYSSIKPYACMHACMHAAFNHA